MYRMMDDLFEPSPGEDRTYLFGYLIDDVFKNSVVNLELKGCVAIDRQSRYAADTRYGVYQEADNIFSAYLTETDVEKQKNSYYKLQILQRSSDPIRSGNSEGPNYWLLQTYGGIGAACYKYNETQMELWEALREFQRIFEKLTGNVWALRANFEKDVLKMNLLEIDYTPNEVIFEKETSLLEPVREMIKLMIQSKLTRSPPMLTYDTRIWPMGRLSSRHIEKAFTVLHKLVGCITECDPGEIDKKTTIDLSNLYYSLVPRTLVSGSLRILNTLEAVQTELEYLDSLPTKFNTYISIKSLYDRFHYKLKPMNTGEAFHQILEICVQNTESPGLEVLEIFELERHSENTHYSHFNDFENKMLLWHGTPLWTFPEILRQGLVIQGVARSGSLGTGIYFADLVQKALKYCRMSSKIGCLILCEVALGRIKEVIAERSNKRRRSMETANESYDSVLACGKLIPDPKEVHVEFASGALLPLGKPVRSPPPLRSRRYNEYVVYNEGQVKLRYLVKVRTLNIT